MSTFRLICLVHGEATERAFAVDISDGMAIFDLKKRIKIEKQPVFDQFAPDMLNLWKVNIPLRAVDDPVLKALRDNPRADIEGVLKGVKLTDPTYEVGEHWQEPPKFHIHVIIEPPSVDEHDAKKYKVDIQQVLPEYWIKYPYGSNFRDNIGPFQILNKVLYQQVYEMLKNPKKSISEVERHPSFICFLDGPGVGKSRFLRQVACDADAHVVWTSFEYGLLQSVINHITDSKIIDKSASDVVNHLYPLWLKAFLMIFLRISTMPMTSRLYECLAHSDLPNVVNVEEVRHSLGNALKELSNLMGDRSLLLILDEAQNMGIPPPRLNEFDTIDELLMACPQVYTKKKFINPKGTPLASYFISVAFHRALQSVVPLALQYNIVLAVVGIDPSLRLYKTLARSGLQAFSFCEHIAELLPYFCYKNVEFILKYYLKFEIFQNKAELARTISDLVGPPRITEIFLQNLLETKSKCLVLSDIVNNTYNDYCSRYNLLNQENDINKNLFEQFYNLLYFPGLYGGIISKDVDSIKVTSVLYPIGSAGYDHINDHHREMTMAGLLRIEYRRMNTAFSISEPYPFAHKVLRSSAGLKYGFDDLIKENLLRMKTLHGHAFEYAVMLEFSYVYSPFYGIISRFTGYNPLPSLKEMYFVPFKTITSENRNNSDILNDANGQYIQWARDKNAKDSMKIDIWTFCYKNNPEEGLPLVIDIFIQVTARQKGSDLDKKLNETLRHWLFHPILKSKPAIYMFISRHTVTLPLGFIKRSEGGLIEYTGVKTSTSSKLPSIKNWLFVIDGDYNLSSTVLPLLNLVDLSPAEFGVPFHVTI